MRIERHIETASGFDVTEKRRNIFVAKYDIMTERFITISCEGYKCIGVNEDVTLEAEKTYLSLRITKTTSKYYNSTCVGVIEISHGIKKITYDYDNGEILVIDRYGKCKRISNFESFEVFE